MSEYNELESMLKDMWEYFNLYPTSEVLCADNPSTLSIGYYIVNESSVSELNNYQEFRVSLSVFRMAPKNIRELVETPEGRMKLGSKEFLENMFGKITEESYVFIE